MKRLQNRIAEGGLTLPTAALVGLLVWLPAGLVGQRLWPQLAVFVATVYLLVELSNANALLRVRSRMVSSTFIVLMCTASFLFPSLSGGVVQLCTLAALVFLFQTYQDPLAVGRAYYAFLFLGLGSTAGVQLLWLVPVLWVLMATQLQALSGRTWLASLMGLCTPYWLLMPVLLLDGSLAPLGRHMAGLWHVQVPAYDMPAGHILAFLFTVVLAAVAVVHFWHYSYEDKIRIRLLFGLFTTMTVVCLLLTAVQPSLAGLFLPVAFVFVSPLVAHLFTFTGSRLSNALFFVVLAVALLITAVNLWMPSLQL